MLASFFILLASLSVAAPCKMFRAHLPMQSLFNVASRRAICVSAVRCQPTEKVFKVKRDRELVHQYNDKDHKIRFEWAQPEDTELVIDFMSEVAAKQEPTSISTGTTAAEFRPYNDFLLKNGGLKYTMLAVENDRIIGGAIARDIELDRSKAVKPELRTDFGDLIDELEAWIPSRNMRRVVAPAYYLTQMVPNFLPKETKRSFRLELFCVQKSVTGGDIGKRIAFELAAAAIRDGFKHADAELTAKASGYVLEKFHSKTVFSVDFDKMLDHGERIHKKVPLIDGGTKVKLSIVDLAALARQVAHAQSSIN